MTGRRRHRDAVGTGAAALLAALLAGGCSEDMRDQPRADALEASAFFADGASARPPVEGTVPRHPLEPPPPEVTMEVLELGRERFEGICAVCHGRDGYGDGIVPQRGFPAPPSLHEARLRSASDAHILRVMEQGLGKMPTYREILSEGERVAVLAYVRALQLSQHADASRLPGALRERLEAIEEATP